MLPQNKRIFFFPILWFPALAREMSMLRKHESHTLLGSKKVRSLTGHLQNVELTPLQAPQTFPEKV